MKDQDPRDFQPRSYLPKTAKSYDKQLAGALTNLKKRLPEKEKDRMAELITRYHEMVRILATLIAEEKQTNESKVQSANEFGRRKAETLADAREFMKGKKTLNAEGVVSLNRILNRGL